MPEIVVVGSLRARQGQEAQAREALEALVEPTHAEDGCVLYALHQSSEDPTRLCFVERWASPEHHEARIGTPHIQALLERVDELFSEPPDIVRYDPVVLGDPRKGALAPQAAGT